MKKILFLVLALCLCLALAACGDNTPDDGFVKPDGGYEGGGDGGSGDGGDGDGHTHAWGSWTVSLVPTYEAGGTLMRYCPDCPWASDTLEIPALNGEDYIIRRAWGDGDITCGDGEVTVEFIYRGQDERGDFEIQVWFDEHYSVPHAIDDDAEYTVWTKENHYKACSDCGACNSAASEAHTMADGECTVCHYVPDQLIYDDNGAYSSGVSYTANEQTVVIPKHYGGSNPEKAGFLITSIDSFQNNDALVSLTIPSTVKFIAYNAFSGCTSLENIYYDGTWADWCDINMTDITSNPMSCAKNFYMRDENGEWKKVTEINIPDTVTEIRPYLFVGFVGIEKLTIPASVKKIGNSFCDGFATCHNYHWIWEDGIAVGISCNFGKVYYGGTIDDWCRLDFSKYARVNEKANELYIWENGGYVSVDTITEINVPEDVTKIEDYKFYGFTALEEIKVLGKISEIGDYAFYGCTALRSVDVGAGCKYIQPDAFGECPALVSVTLPKNLEWISSGNFYQSDLLRNVFFNGTIADWCEIDFGGRMDNGKAITSSPLRNGTSDFYILNESGEYVEPFKINNYVTVNNGSPLSLSMRFLVIPEEVTYIGAFQFYGLQAMNNEEYTVIIEGDVTEIGDAAFAGANIGSVFMPKSVTTIHGNVFDGSFDAYSKIYYEGTAAEWANVLISSNITDVTIWYYAVSADKVSGATCWCWGDDGFVYEWVSSGTGFVATVNKVLSIKNWETLT
jgi:hypothetical protein